MSFKSLSLRGSACLRFLLLACVIAICTNLYSQNWYIPNDVNLFSTPMVLVNVGETPPTGYILADQTCAQEVADVDPFCTTTDWDFPCQD
ncbi:MAG: hypothetical protein AAF193_04375, partial [Bacteroidota bacterium]